MRIFHFFEGILNLKKVMDVECWLEARHTSSWGKEGRLSAGGAAEGELSLSVCDHQSLEAVFAVDMEALEQFGVFEGIKADGTG